MLTFALGAIARAETLSTILKPADGWRPVNTPEIMLALRTRFRKKLSDLEQSPPNRPANPQ